MFSGFKNGSTQNSSNLSSSLFGSQPSQPLFGQQPQQQFVGSDYNNSNPFSNASINVNNNPHSSSTPQKSSLTLPVFGTAKNSTTISTSHSDLNNIPLPKTLPINNPQSVKNEKEEPFVVVNKQKVYIDPKFVLSSYKFVAEEFICSICLNTSYEPKECRNCSSIFCKPCITEWYTRNKSACPSKCFGGYTETDVNRNIKNIMNKIQLKCFQECDQVITYGQIPSHLKQCSNSLYQCRGCKIEGIKNMMEKHVLICDLQLTKCSLCSMELLRKDLNHHKENDCENAQITCPYCKEIFIRKNYQNHGKDECFTKITRDFDIKLSELKKENESLRHGKLIDLPKGG